MCNLFTLSASVDEVAAAFRARKPENFNAGPGDVFPGGPAMVIREDDRQRILQAMTWGFPLRFQSMKPESRPKPVNNIANLTSYMWRFIADKAEHRCLIPLTAFAEAEGAKGSKTRTWFSIKDRPVFAWAGMWKVSDEWGAVCSGLMTDANEMVAPVHTRMPVLLHQDEHDRWLRGSLDEVHELRDRILPAGIMSMTRTEELWSGQRKSA